MAVDEALIAAMEKIRDAMMDFEVAADRSGLSGHEKPPEMDAGAPEYPEGSPAEEQGESAQQEEGEDKPPGFTALGSYRFPAKKPAAALEIDVKSPHKMPVGRRR